MIASAECNPETDPNGCEPGGGGGGGPTTDPSWYMDHLRMVFADWTYDGVPFGKPEFEVWLVRCNGSSLASLSCTAPLDPDFNVPCAGESYSSSSSRDFNYDDPPAIYTDDFRVASGNRLALDLKYKSIIGGVEYSGTVLVSENDDTSCPSSGEPDLGEFGESGDDWIFWGAIPKTTDTLTFVNPNGTDPGDVKFVWSPDKSF